MSLYSMTNATEPNHAVTFFLVHSVQELVCATCAFIQCSLDAIMISINICVVVNHTHTTGN